MQGVLDGLSKLWSDLWRYITTDPLGIGIGGSFIAAVLFGLLQWFTRWPGKALGWIRDRIWPRRRVMDATALDVVTDPAILLPRIYGTESNTSPLADHRLPYQVRTAGRDLQGELRAILHDKHYLLLTGRTGLGKTREAAMLATSLMHERYRVVRVTKQGWLDAPATLPAALGDDHRRILVILDDLNGLFRAGESQKAVTGDASVAAPSPYHDRLLAVLDAFEQICGPGEVRVLATARSEPDQWRVLGFSASDRLWMRFERFELPEPDQNAVTNLMQDALKSMGESASDNDLKAIARVNDGTFMNVAVNLERLRSRGLVVTPDNFEPTLDGSWRKVFLDMAERYPATSFVFDAIDVLRQAGVGLYDWVVEPMAEHLWGGSWWQRFLRRARIRRTLRYLVQDRKLIPVNDGAMTPRDGQIEAKGKTADWKYLLPVIWRLLVRLAPDHLDSTADSLLSLARLLVETGHRDQADDVLRDVLATAPKSASRQFAYGYLMAAVGRHQEAEVAYREAIARDPNNTAAINNLGNVLVDLKRLDEAEVAYRDVIARIPNGAMYYSNLGNVLVDLKRLDEAEAAYREAIARDPNDAAAYNNLGNLLVDLERLDEAEAAYREAIARDPNDAATHNNLGTLLCTLKRLDEAEAAYREAIARDPNDAAAYHNLGNVLRDLKRLEEAEAAYRQAIARDPNDVTAHYNLGVLLRDFERPEEAEAVYRGVITLDQNEAEAHMGLGFVLFDLKRWDEAEAAFRVAIARDPNNEMAFLALIPWLNHRKRWEPLEDGLPLFERLHELHPRGHSALALAGTHQALGHLAEFRQWLTAARVLLTEDEHYNRACVEALSGNRELALDALQRAAEDPGFDRDSAAGDPDFAEFRDDPRFQAIITGPGSSSDM